VSIDLSNKTVCVVDNGLYVAFARKIAPAFGRCLYHVPFQSPFPSINEVASGRGFPELEWCEQPLLEADNIDLWIFLYLYQSGLQVYLRKQGARVWGPGEGDDMELYRWEFSQKVKAMGLPVTNTIQIKGVDALREYLIHHKETCFVKTSFVRGDFETFKVEDYKVIEPYLDELEHKLGVKKEDYEFIVDDEIPNAVEVGYDGFTINGQFPSQGMQGYEIKDAGMVACVKPYEQLAEPVKFINSKMSETLKGYNYCGFWATEIRYTKDKKSFFYDPCCRLGSPSNELLQELFDNWPEVLWFGAEGELVTPRVKAKFGVAAVIESDWAETNWLSIDYPKSIDQYVKLRFHLRYREKDYIVPLKGLEMGDVGYVVGTGNTLDEAVKICKERAKLIKGFRLHINVEAIDKGLDVIKEGEKYGIKF
jgi:hypothetical protein